ncbi:MAG: hypothetical protein KGJ21_09765 [Pseudomonadota bacterium]|nr:hypothetical protein [Pseudomonadota bacterium]
MESKKIFLGMNPMERWIIVIITIVAVIGAWGASFFGMKLIEWLTIVAIITGPIIGAWLTMKLDKQRVKNG